MKCTAAQSVEAAYLDIAYMLSEEDINDDAEYKVIQPATNISNSENTDNTEIIVANSTVVGHDRI